MTVTGFPLFVLLVCFSVGAGVLSAMVLFLAVALIWTIWRWFLEQLFETGQRIAARKRMSTPEPQDHRKTTQDGGR